MISAEKLATFSGPPPAPAQSNASEFEMNGYLQRWGFVVTRTKPKGTRTVYELAQCPFCADHIDGSAAFFMDNGVPGFHCHHNGCQGKTIKEVFRVYPTEQTQRPCDVYSEAVIAPESIEADLAEAEELPDFPEHAWRGVFADYRNAMQGTTEASDVAHFTSLWAALATTLGRKVRMYAGDYVYPNVYLAIFGGTGDKKTTAMRRPLSLDLIPPHVKVVRNVGSAEGLADALKRDDGADAVSLLYWEELTNLLARGRWAGATILEFLTETFDCPPTWGLEYRKNKVEIGNPTPTIITGTTMEWFWKNARAEDFHGGFGNRVLFLTGKPKPPIPDPVEPERESLARVQSVFRRLSQLSATDVRFDSEAEALWRKFYVQFENQLAAGLHGAATKRIHVYVRKLAMVYAASEGTLPLITEPQLRAAIGVGKYASKSVQLLLDFQSAGNSRGGDAERRVLDWLRKRTGPIDKRFMQQTLSKSVGDCETFNRTIRNLQQAGHIEVNSNRVHLR